MDTIKETNYWASTEMRVALELHTFRLFANQTLAEEYKTKSWIHRAIEKHKRIRWEKEKKNTIDRDHERNAEKRWEKDREREESEKCV